MTESVRVRFPPSPTGFCHVGTARMAILNFLFARKHGGAIIFRSEDTDKERSTREYEEDITDSLMWLGLGWDEFYRQSERTSIYREALKRLIDADRAYVSEEESKKEAGTMVQVIRLRNPGKTITFRDELRGDITFDTTELKDFVIARSMEEPLYHLAVVVDDADMRISHVIRGEDHISNTPRQILIQEALGFERPAYAHYPLHLGSDRSKLSKRKGDVAVRDYRAKGYLSEALLNYLATLGWTPPSGREILTLPEMIEEFELKDLHKSGAIFDIEKLRWFNRHYLLEMPEAEFGEQGIAVLREALEARNVPWNEKIAAALIPNLRERISVWEDIRELSAEDEFDYFFSDPVLDASKISGKGSDVPTGKRHLERLGKFLGALTSTSYADPEMIKNAIWEYATKEGRGPVLWPLRYALTGRERSPDPFVVSSVIGKEATVQRIESGLKTLENA